VLPHPPHHGPRPQGDPGSGTEERIVDAALAAFTEHGIRATTMSQVARDAGISREWLYKHFRNRDALAVAVLRREAVRFIDGLAVRAFHSVDVESAVTDAVIYAIEFLRDHALLQRIVRSEPDALGPALLHDAAPVLGLAVQTGAGYLSALSDLTPEEATVVAETLVRLVASTAVAPRGALDLHDPDQLRRYAEAVVPAVLASAAAHRVPATRR
jgi:AcrR family transcriptional regulator